MSLASGWHLTPPVGWVPDFGILGQVRSNSSQSSSTHQEMDPFRNILGRFISRPSLPESVSLSDLPPKDYDSSAISTPPVSETRSVGGCQYFSQLPMEIQLQIWTAAAKQEPYDGSRIFSLTPSSHRFAITLQDVNTLYTVVSQPRALPAVFQICRNSRAAAKKEYALLPTDFASRRGERKMVYAHKIHDTLFFQKQSPAQYGLLRTTFGTDLSNLGEEGYIKPEATRLFFKHLDNFRHIAVDWDIWWAFQGFGYLPLNWPRVLPSLDEILIVLTLERTLRVPLYFRRISPGTVRGQSAEVVMSMVVENIEAFRLEFPEKEPPKIRVVAFSDGNESSHGDEAFLATMRQFRARFPPNVYHSQ
ncbi:hypothetical protein N431DRAFT_471887 [Stipitochalara longipes BDJ]|nr:hypothetical protein N431DRAFT_471887 [Stipitochalara longipes BDJ]